MQKLLTLYIRESYYAHVSDKKNGAVEEHLVDYLEKGWRVVSITALGGATLSESSKVIYLEGCFAVLIEK